jgi:hypothetical protein
MRVERNAFEDYAAHLMDKHRPPSKGGNTRAWHRHVLTVNGERYSFLALGSKRWAYVEDTIGFEWSFDPSGRYGKIDRGSIQTWAKDGTPVKCGEPGAKPWRTAAARMPGSRREQRD